MDNEEHPGSSVIENLAKLLSNFDEGRIYNITGILSCMLSYPDSILGVYTERIGVSKDDLAEARDAIEHVRNCQDCLIKLSESFAGENSSTHDKTIEHEGLIHIFINSNQD